MCETNDEVYIMQLLFEVAAPVCITELRNSVFFNNNSALYYGSFYYSCTSVVLLHFMINCCNCCYCGCSCKYAHNAINLRRIN